MATTAKLWSTLRAAQAHKTTPRVISSGQGAYLTIEGEPKLNFCSSHYLGFAVEPRLKKAAQVRKPPRWPRSWANFSLLQLHSHV
jgi:glycine C-acetyltransferase